ncbi:MAG: aminotransferase class V-fold PLP-dependent enzyme, partial [Candidatus Obscuribacter sp.]|nr:aminotransferase class V-fold PLP-dependent enzyme [Candidatus Obscuribacter sp.]
SGDHCTYLSEQSESQDDFIRVSMHLYNDKDDVDQFVDVLANCIG